MIQRRLIPFKSGNCRMLINLLVFILLVLNARVFADDNMTSTIKNKDHSEYFYAEYSGLMKALKANGISVEKQLNEDVIKYITDKADHLIGILPGNKGLKWIFSEIIYLRKDLIFVSYDDGEMYGGDVLIKITLTNNKVVSMKTIWNSGKN